jgi:hypothetical protein
MTDTARRTAGAAVSVLLVGATMTLLAVAGGDTAGTRALPAFPALAGTPLPDASGTVAVVVDGAVPCVTVVDVASGDSRDLHCERDLVGDRPRWTAEGDLEVLRRDGSG